MKEKIIKGIPNTCSVLNAFCGLMAILLTVFYDGKNAINVACLLILCGGLFDSMDGLLARKLEATSDIGKQLDSFADLITFGIAPITAFLTLHSVNMNHRIHLIEIIIAAFYVLCAMYRLARYNVSAYRPYFQGLPTTAAGVIMSWHVFICNMFVDNMKKRPTFGMMCSILIFMLGLLMISKIKVGKPGAKTECCEEVCDRHCKRV